MQGAYKAGFVKFATEVGHSAEQAEYLWKRALECPELSEYYNSLPAYELKEAEAEDLDTLWQLKNQIQEQYKLAELKVLLDSSL